MVNQIRVLLADDEAVLLESITKLLTRRGMLVRTALNGREALEILATEQFDVIVLDARMPVMDGITAMAEIRRNDTLTPVLFLSGQADLARVTEALKRGATDYLLKPCEVEVLVSAIENACERKAIGLEIAKKTPKKQHRDKS
jgi:two-component system OmpR family response regulator